MIYVGEPKQGCIPIARTFRSSYMGAYILEIAAGVDIGICVMMCVALDEHCREWN